MTYILAIDQGTTSSRAIVFDCDMKIVASDQKEFTQHFPHSGWVEHDANEIWDSVVTVVNGALKKSGITASDVAAIGITNQRETTVVWDKVTGQPVYNAIVWQDRRTASLCDDLKTAGHEAMITEKTGLLLDPYFSGTKVKWILDTVEGARDRVDDLLFGTIDSFLIWKMTGNHFTDATNAARTMLYNIVDGQWDDEICTLYNIPMHILPQVKDCNADFGTTDIFGAPIPILGVAGDQQAATIGQACFEPGMLKSTYGTGCFALINTGDELKRSENRLLGTIAYQLDGQVTYALEGSIFIAGSVVQWLRDGLKIIGDATETQIMAENANDEEQVYLVPAFTGLGAPYWDADCRGAMFGLTRNTGPNDFARAALRAVGYQTRDLLEAMQSDMGGAGRAKLRVDGGMTASDYTMQFLSDIIDAPVDRPTILETTAMGVAWLAGSKAGIYPDKAGFSAMWALDRTFVPQMDCETRDRLYIGWKDAVSRTLTKG